MVSLTYVKVKWWTYRVKEEKKKRKKPFVRLEISVLMTEEVSCQERERWKQFPAMESKRADNEKDYQ